MTGIAGRKVEIRQQPSAAVFEATEMFTGAIRWEITIEVTTRSDAKVMSHLKGTIVLICSSVRRKPGKDRHSVQGRFLNAVTTFVISKLVGEMGNGQKVTIFLHPSGNWFSLKKVQNPVRMAENEDPSKINPARCCCPALETKVVA